MSKPLYFIAALSFFCLTHSIVEVSSSSICSHSADCGNGFPIRYPFWVNNNSSQEYCGYPDFDLKCSDDGRPFISLPNDAYYVTDINYHNYTLTLVDMDVVDQPCPRARHNVSLGNLPLSVNNQLNMNLSFYFNCSVSNKVNNLPSNPIRCLKNEGSKQSYIETTPWDTYGLNIECEEKVVVVVVKQEEISSDTLVTGFGEAMNKGFVLDWRRAMDCSECEMSGGLCGQNPTNNQTLCFCGDGSFATKSCSKARTGGRALRNKLIIDVKKMTNSFKDKLGQGGYGSVYKGKLLNGHPVAVKLLKASKENGEEFINEVASSSRTSHVNVVTLLGFCFEGKQKALIYEFMCNGSLDKFIHNNADKNSLCLTWENLYQIAIGIARGLEYLHRGCNTRILHFDIKPHNILLDENFCPKISDFGLAKLCPKKESIISISEARGTIGYLAPEVWNRNIGGVSYKSDVYSYGMMLLDMVGGRKNMNVETNCSTKKYFPNYIYVQLEQDSNLGCNGASNAEEHDIAKRMTIVGLWCIQTFPSQRPTMSRVIEMLERKFEPLEMPPKPVMPSPPRLELESSTIATTTTEILGFQSSSHMLLEEH
ncbi:LEAF RUST 10 DISEASE-RESISTANCE LOCUS RECEPTOR-LIKE PROTEIN KINASE-like 2.1 isoform X2 [Neltuma alba]|uniref:LEAF RUST 10 DISEASE-RESISTANCE LOCUS RECEPTOR-LIKE PROTEIN KINASE-like 2.1 isoform X2 n=1 Tax=Neltuma alba TaxID=207710 RepID=UPI0010A5393D|nr:LEAF RUST 10 DISEASE-RESISTANCE LOCUS RECEPTOR-LIKE PROTEIN KINASE-like 2.1 isoform X2 [Prosopis alba]